MLPLGGGDVADSAFDGGEWLFVSSTEDGLVVRIDLSSLASMTIATELSSAEGIACGPDDRLYVTQSSVFGGPRRIVSIAFDGSDLRVDLDFETEPLLSGSGGPEGPSFGPGGDLFFNTNPSGGSSTGAWKLSPGGDPVQVVPPFSDYSEATLFPKLGPFAGHLLLVDQANERILRRPPPFESAEAALEFITDEISAPNGLAEDSEGNLYIASTAGSIQQFSSGGTFLGQYGATDLTHRKIAFDGSDNLYVSTVDGPVVRITPSGAHSTVGEVFGGNGIAVCGVEPEPPAPCPLSQGFWKNHPAAWPVASLYLGAQTYDQETSLALFRTPPRGDASLILAHQLLAAKLNIASGSDGGPAVGAIADADAVFRGFAGALPYGVDASASSGQDMLILAGLLDGYNNGDQTPGC